MERQTHLAGSVQHALTSSTLFLLRCQTEAKQGERQWEAEFVCLCVGGGCFKKWSLCRKRGLEAATPCSEKQTS